MSLKEISQENIENINGGGSGWVDFWKGTVVTAAGGAGAFYGSKDGAVIGFGLGGPAGAIVGAAVGGLGGYVGAKIIGL